MKNSLFLSFVAAVSLIALLALTGAFYVVNETEQAILTQFGQPIGEPVTQAGLHFKIPFIQQVHRIDKRVLQWESPSNEMPTKDKLYIVVDTFARWRISQPLQYFLRLKDERSALSRLDDIIGSETRNTVARHELVEMIRTTKERQPAQDETVAAARGNPAAALPPIRFGRVALEQEIAKLAREKLAEFGIELLDVRFKRINYNAMVSSKIYDRMISERRQIAERFRSEGAGEAAKILGKRERDIKEIESKAYREAQAIQGKADAEATAIYAQAFNQSPEAREFYAFQRSLEAYRAAFERDTTVILSTDQGFLRFLKGNPSQPTSPTAGHPAPPPAPPAPEAQ